MRNDELDLHREAQPAQLAHIQRVLVMIDTAIERGQIERAEEPRLLLMGLRNVLMLKGYLGAMPPGRIGPDAPSIVALRVPFDETKVNRKPNGEFGSGTGGGEPTRHAEGRRPNKPARSPAPSPAPSPASRGGGVAARIAYLATLQADLKAKLPTSVTVTVDPAQPLDEQIKFLEGLRDLNNSKIGRSLFVYMKGHPETSVEVNMVDKFDDTVNFGHIYNGTNVGHPGNVVGTMYPPTSSGSRIRIEVSTTQLKLHNDAKHLVGVDRHSIAEIVAHELGHAADAIERAFVGDDLRPLPSKVTGIDIGQAAACYAGMAYRREIGAGDWHGAAELNRSDCSSLTGISVKTLPYSPVVPTGSDVQNDSTKIP